VCSVHGGVVMDFCKNGCVYTSCHSCTFSFGEGMDSKFNYKCMICRNPLNCEETITRYDTFIAGFIESAWAECGLGYDVGMGADLTAGDLYKYYDDEEDSDYSHSEDESEGEREDVSED
jgi:hypothetical protein